MNTLIKTSFTGENLHLEIAEDPGLPSPDGDLSDAQLRKIKQRTTAWLDLRDDGSISSSDLGTAFGFFTVSRARQIQAKVWTKVNSIQILIIAVFGHIVTVTT